MGPQEELIFERSAAKGSTDLSESQMGPGVGGSDWTLLSSVMGFQSWWMCPGSRNIVM